jgi:hypothetical protein
MREKDYWTEDEVDGEKEEAYIETKEGIIFSREAYEAFKRGM